MPTALSRRRPLSVLTTLLRRLLSALVLPFLLIPAVGAPQATAVERLTTCTDIFGNPNTCAEAVAWAKARLGTSDPAYAGYCDRYAARAYGFERSGSTSAFVHWQQIPSGKGWKNGGNRTVPAGALAFFQGGSKGYGHVMLSLGDGTFASTDVGANGRYQKGSYNRTTIATVEDSFNMSYIGWAQPWFQANH